MIGSESDRHHTVEGEVEEGREHEEHVPEKLNEGPFEFHHGIRQHSVNDDLEEVIWYLD